VTSDDVIVCDLDGVLWRGEVAIPGSAAAVGALRAAGRRVAFLTNNSSHRIIDVIDRLAAIGVPAAPDDVLSSAQAAAALLASDLPPGARVLTCAGPGVVEALVEAGYDTVDGGVAYDGQVDAVVVGFHREFDFDRLDRASDAIRRGARFVATNLDATYPGTNRVLPGAGSLVAAVATASGCAPEVAGKPEAATVALVQARLGPDGVMVGDRPSTDGELAHRLGWPYAMVLSGIGGHDPTEPIPTDPAPNWVADDLAGLADALGRYPG
jgi:Predicted sugar phosphatases of the HAD superfamily